MTRQHKPDLSVKFAPRVPQRLRKAVNRICKACEMPEADVLRYSMEAAALLAHAGKVRLLRPVGDHTLDAMMTVRTSKAIAKTLREIHERMSQRDRYLLHADVLRRCLETMLPVAELRGMGHVLRLREATLAALRSRSSRTGGQTRKSK